MICNKLSWDVWKMINKKELLHFSWQSLLISKKSIEKILQILLEVFITMIIIQIRVWINIESGHHHIKADSFSQIQRHQAVFHMKQTRFKTGEYLLIEIQEKIIFCRSTIPVDSIVESVLWMAFEMRVVTWMIQGKRISFQQEISKVTHFKNQVKQCKES